MFYSQDILQKRGGRFSMIWLAATKMSKLNRRNIASVNIVKSCNDILEIVELRAEPGPSGKRPRFSLYLSALLMSGVIRIHEQQTKYLLEDVTAALVRITKSLMDKMASKEDIDLQAELRKDLVTIPEFELTEDEFKETLECHFITDEELKILLGCPDPAFWRMETSSSDRSTAGALSPQLQIGSPQRPPAAPAQGEQGEQLQPDVDSELQVPKEKITLQELPVILEREEIPQLDLPHLDGTQIDMTLPAVDQFPLGLQDVLLPTSTPAETEQTRPKRKRPRQDKQTEVPEPEVVQEPKTPERRPSQEVPETRAVQPSPGVTLPVITITSPLPHRQPISLDPLETVSPARRRRKRQLVFADAETQIPKVLMKKNLTHTADITEKFLLPEAIPLSVSEILNLPAGRNLQHPHLLPFWRRNAKTRRNPQESETPETGSPSSIQAEVAAGAQPQPQSPEFIAVPLTGLDQPQLSPVVPQPDLSSIEERPSIFEASIEALKQASASGAAIVEDVDMSAIEEGRDISTSRVEQTEISIEDTSLKDSSRKRSATKRRKTSSSTSSSLVAEQDSVRPGSSVSQTRILYDVQEEHEHRVEDLGGQPTPVVPLVPPAQISEEVITEPVETRRTLLREVRDELEGSEETETTFRRLCPPAVTDRKTAALKFTALIDLCAQKKLRARQTESYGDIIVTLPRD